MSNNFKIVYNDCISPSEDNPYMNHLYLGDTMQKPCDVSQDEINKLHQNSISSTASKIFYTVPARQELTGNNFASFLYPNLSTCRDSGYICRANSEGTQNTERIIKSYDKHENLYKKYE